MADHNHTIEEWRTVRGFTDYSVSDLGRVRRDRSPRPRDINRVVQPGTDQSGYLRVRLCMLHGKRHVSVHRLVAETFIGEFPVGLTINHKNGDKLDNRAVNLEYCTRQANSQHATRLGLRVRGERQHLAKLNVEQIPVIRSMIRDGKTDAQIAPLFGVIPATIWWIRRGKTWKHVADSV